MLHINTVHVQRETLWVKQLAGEQYKMICSAWACKHTYIAESFVGLCTHSSVWKVSSAHRGECATTGGFVQAHSPVCSTLWIAQKSFIQFFFFGVVRLGGVWRGRGGGVIHVSGGRGLHGVSEGGGVFWSVFIWRGPAGRMSETDRDCSSRHTVCQLSHQHVLAVQCGPFS